MTRISGKFRRFALQSACAAAALWMGGCLGLARRAAPPSPRPAAEAPRRVRPEAYAHFCAGLTACFQGRWKHAAEELAAAIDADPMAAPAYVYFVRACERSDQKDMAARRLLRWAKVRPDNFRANWSAGLYLDRWGMEDAAIEALERARRCDVPPANRPALYACLRRLAQIRLGRGELREALDCYEQMRALRLAPGPVVDFDVARAYMECKRYADAVRWFEKVAKAKPQFAPAFKGLAEAYNGMKQYDRGVAPAKRYLALARPEESWQTRLLLADLYAKTQRTPQAEREREKVRQILVKKIRLGRAGFYEYFQLNLLLRQARRYDEALAALRPIRPFVERASVPEITIAYRLALAQTFYDKGDDRETEKQLKAALRLDPRRDDVCNFLGYLYAERGERLDEAERLIRRALKRQPDNPAYLDSLGWVYFQQAAAGRDARKFSQAVRLLERAAEKLDDPVISGHLAEAYYALGQWDAAERRWRLALELYKTRPYLRPGPREVERHLEQLRRLREQRSRPQAAARRGQD